LDGSPAAESVLPWVELIARSIGSQVRLVTVASKDLPLQAAERYLQTKQTALSGVHADYSAIQGNGSPAEAVLALAADWDADLVALTSHSRSGLAAWNFGSVAEKIIHGSGCAVLLVRPNPKPTSAEKPSINKILVPLDGSHLSQSVLPGIAELAKSLGATLTLVNVIELFMAPAISQTLWDRLEARSQDFLDSVSQDVEQHVPCDCEVRFGSAIDQILQAAAESHVDLIAMASHGHSGIGRWIMGSVAEALVRRSDLPCLVLRPAAA
jgi:nucleotide-binding universal stress UspA family protein